MERVQRLAGVSRGALTHHFGSMNDLLVAAISSIAIEQGNEISSALAAADGPPLDALVHTMHGMMERPVFLAGLELWSAARTDDSLRAALAASARSSTTGIRQSVLAAFDPPLAAHEGSLAFDGLMSLLRGLALGSVVRDRPEREREILRCWLDHFASGAATS